MISDLLHGLDLHGDVDESMMCFLGTGESTGMVEDFCLLWSLVKVGENDCP